MTKSPLVCLPASTSVHLLQRSSKTLDNIHGMTGSKGCFWMNWHKTSWQDDSGCHGSRCPSPFGPLWLILPGPVAPPPSLSHTSLIETPAVSWLALLCQPFCPARQTRIPNVSNSAHTDGFISFPAKSCEFSKMDAKSRASVLCRDTRASKLQAVLIGNRKRGGQLWGTKLFKNTRMSRSLYLSLLNPQASCAWPLCLTS